MQLAAISPLPTVSFQRQGRILQASSNPLPTRSLTTTPTVSQVTFGKSNPLAKAFLLAVLVLTGCKQTPPTSAPQPSPSSSPSLTEQFKQKCQETATQFNELQPKLKESLYLYDRSKSEYNDKHPNAPFENTGFGKRIEAILKNLSNSDNNETLERQITELEKISAEFERNGQSISWENIATGHAKNALIFRKTLNTLIEGLKLCQGMEGIRKLLDQLEQRRQSI